MRGWKRGRDGGRKGSSESEAEGERERKRWTHWEEVYPSPILLPAFFRNGERGAPQHGRCRRTARTTTAAAAAACNAVSDGRAEPEQQGRDGRKFLFSAPAAAACSSVPKADNSASVTAARARSLLRLISLSRATIKMKRNETNDADSLSFFSLSPSPALSHPLQSPTLQHWRQNDHGHP